jgi:hypothetical protein
VEAHTEPSDRAAQSIPSIDCFRKTTQRRYRGTDRPAEQPRSAKQLRKSGDRASRLGGSWSAGESGLLVHLLHGSAGSIVEASIVQDFVSVLSLSARKKVGQAVADRVVAETAQRVYWTSPGRSGRNTTAWSATRKRWTSCGRS